MTKREMDQTTAEVNAEEGDFADEHSAPTHADEHPQGTQIETDESTPEDMSGMD